MFGNLKCLVKKGVIDILLKACVLSAVNIHRLMGALNAGYVYIKIALQVENTMKTTLRKNYLKPEKT